MPFIATWMHLEIIILSEVSQKEKGKYHMISHTWNLIYSTNEFTEKKIMDLENRLVVAKGEEEGGGWIGNLGLIDGNYCLWNG